ncbi:hypothetical protein CARUB_v10006925mg [Capsella rubella]|uniref:F-box associated beta-propeller type 3 domain-containing protein n=2 Tax=Capsella rubella TaxID=81985 RepID=R0GX75_9BRAS|nr:hypothetical protein CARUB_v10006925mg [Capsella rubella]
MKSYLVKSSSSRPRSLVFTLKDTKLRTWKHFFFSVSQPQNRGASSSSSFVATYHMNCHSQPYTTYSASVHGLICHGHPSKLMVYNPSTRGSITLPRIDSERVDMHHFLGYDPVSGDYKVLCFTPDDAFAFGQSFRVLTLGKENSWRIVQDYPLHFLDHPYSPDICIDGVLYYGVCLDNEETHAVMCFDVRSEKFDLIKLPDITSRISCLRLTSYEGTLAVLFTGDSRGRFNLWVLKDAVKHEWSKNEYVLPPSDGETYDHFRPFCVANGGEVVLAPLFVFCKEPYSVIYYNIKKNAVRRVYIEGIFTELKEPLWDKDSYHCTFSVFPAQIDNLMFL